MSAIFSAPVQTAIYERLSTDAAVTTLVGSNVFDAVPAGPVPELYVLIGEESARDVSDSTSVAALHDIAVHIISTTESFLALKQSAGAISDALLLSPLAISQGHVAGIWARSSQAKRNASGQRKIELKFRLRVEA